MGNGSKTHGHLRGDNKEREYTRIVLLYGKENAVHDMEGEKENQMFSQIVG